MISESDERISALANLGIRVPSTARRIFGVKALNQMASDLLGAGSFQLLSVGSKLILPQFDNELSCVAIGDSSGFAASGVLIAPDVVLTAAHVVKKGLWFSIGFGTTFNGLRRVVHGIGRKIHPGYQSSPKVKDLAVILLDSRITNVKPAKLANKLDVEAADRLIVVGFGETDTLSTGSKNTISPKIRRRVNSRILAGNPGVDICIGDSGGPAYVVGADGKNQLAAIASESYAIFNTNSVCGDGGAYERVDLSATDIADMISSLRLRYPGERPEIQIPPGP